MVLQNAERPEWERRAAAGDAQKVTDLLSALGRSMPLEVDYQAGVVGRVPPLLDGYLLRNGPGLFHRGAMRKKHILDGDGMIRSYEFKNGRVRFRNRFVRTEKYQEEERAGRFLYPTWSTLVPGGFWRNIGGPRQSQAGVTVQYKHGRLLACDDTGLPFAMQLEDLSTDGPYHPTGNMDLRTFAAHSKTDGVNQQWHLYSLVYNRHLQIHCNIVDKNADTVFHHVFQSPRYTYIHDFFVTENYWIFLFHPLRFKAWPMLLGTRSVIDCFSWDERSSNLLYIIDKRDPNRPVQLEASPRFMWHSLNAYEKDGQIIADFVGYRKPDHFIGEQAVMKTIMRQEAGVDSAPGELCRYRMDVREKKLTESVIRDGAYEFPMLEPREVCRRHTHGYFAYQKDHGMLQSSGVARVNVESGRHDVYDFGPDTYVGEPVYVPIGGKSEDAYVLVEGLNGGDQKGFLAVLRADHINDGPESIIQLGHHMPMSFHGCWVGRD